MPEYTLIQLKCWSSDCHAAFDVFTDLSNHHLDAHELPMGGHPLAWLVQEVTLPPDSTPPCFCGHPGSTHAEGTWLMPCGVPECPCSQLTAATPPLSALQSFVGRCRAEGLSYDTFDARVLLDTLGVPPHAPAVDWEAGVIEAVGRWRDRVATPTAPPRRMTNNVARGNPYHYHEHVENGYCATISCQPIEEVQP